MKFAHCGAYNSWNRGQLCYYHLFMTILSAGQGGLGFNWCLGFLASGLLLSLTQPSASMLISSRFCQRKFKATLWWLCEDVVISIVLSSQAFCLPPSSVSYFVPLLPLQSTLPPLPPRSHPPPLCPPTTWHLFRFLPISWQTACISTQRAQCSDPHKSMADKSMLSLFSMPLLPSIFFPVTLLFAKTWTLLN